MSDMVDYKKGMIIEPSPLEEHRDLCVSIVTSSFSNSSCYITEVRIYGILLNESA
jgi:hypothetical protein